MLETRVKDYNFLIRLDRDSQHFKTLYMIMRTLLSAYENSNGEWVLDYDDMCLLKDKLDKVDLKSGRRANKEAIETLKFYHNREALNTAIKNGKYNEKTKELLKGKIKTEPYEDQYSGIAYLLENPRSLLMDVMGTGKTLQSLSVVAAVSKDTDKSLVIAPKSVLLGFEHEVYTHTHLKPFTLPAGREKALKALKSSKEKWDILMVHPENLVAREKSEIASEIAKAICRMPFKAILIDEFHMFKNPDAKRSQVLSWMIKNIRAQDGKPARVHPMTGTLVSENPVNAYFALQIAGTGNLPSQAKFEKYFTITQNIKIKREGPKGPYMLDIEKVVGYKNLDILKKRLEKCSIRRTKEDLKGFPLKTVQTVQVILTGKQKTLYTELEKGIKDSLTDRDDFDTFFSINAKGIRLIQLLNHPHLIGETCKSAKYEALEGILEEVLSDSEQKIVLWTEYRAAVDLIYDLWNEKYGVIKLYGGVDVDKDLEHRFVHGTDRIIAAIPRKAGTGVDFLARARTAVFIDHPRSSTLKSQAIDRLHRRVKDKGELSWLDKMRMKPCTIIFLEAKDTYDERISEQMKSKEVMSKSSTPEISKR